MESTRYGADEDYIRLDIFYIFLLVVCCSKYVFTFSKDMTLNLFVFNWDDVIRVLIKTFLLQSNISWLHHFVYDYLSYCVYVHLLYYTIFLINVLILQSALQFFCNYVAICKKGVTEYVATSEKTNYKQCWYN